MKNEIPENVLAFLNDSSESYGRIKSDEFSQFMYNQCIELKSPIEQLFLIGLYLVCEVNFANLSTVPDNPIRDHNDDVIVTPQWKLESYFIDFAICRHPVDRIVCVELDGHQFHDRDERQRRYEKRRDRCIAARGYTLLHFTGAEVVADPCGVALEAFKLVSDYGGAVHPREADCG